MVWPPDRIVDVGNGYVYFSPTVSTSKVPRGTSRRVCVSCKQARLLIVEELRKGYRHTQHGYTTSSPCENALLYISVIVGNGIIDDKRCHYAYDACKDITQCLNIRRIAINGIPCSPNAICNAVCKCMTCKQACSNYC